MKYHTSLQVLRKRMNELDRVSARIKAKTTELRKLIATIAEDSRPD